MLAMLMAALDQTVVGTAMPRIISELHGLEHYSAVITAYMIASTAVLPIAGKLSDVYGRKPFILCGVLWFMAASAARRIRTMRRRQDRPLPCSQSLVRPTDSRGRPNSVRARRARWTRQVTENPRSRP